LIIPTRNRRQVLLETLRRIEELPDRLCKREIIVVDNGSTDDTASLQGVFPEVRWLDLGENIGSAARNVGAMAARGRLLLMLDDDSWPDNGVLDQLVPLFDERPELGAVACRVRLADPPHKHDAGGVPGIFFNCGGAVRRDAFLDAGGFPIDYDYYVEEYDLCCRLWQNGWRIEPRGELLVWHRRVTANRDNERMLRLLVRNNLRLWARYAPANHLSDCIDSTVDRYRRVAEKEGALKGFQQGLEEGRSELTGRPRRRRPLSQEQYDELLGLGVARETIREWADNHGVRTVAVWTRGKGCEQLLVMLCDLRIRVAAVYDGIGGSRVWRGCPLRNEKQFDPRGVDGVVVGCLSPGVAEDLALDLATKFKGLAVVSAAPWVQSKGVRQAVPA
jgi:GT2 family glycosyltransferase